MAAADAAAEPVRGLSTPGCYARAMDTAEFDYELPDARIAQVPVEPRDAARLLVDRRTGRRAPSRRATSPELLRPGRPARRQRHPGAAGPAASASSRPAARPRCCCSRSDRDRRCRDAGRRWCGPAGELPPGTACVVADGSARPACRGVGDDLGDGRRLRRRCRPSTGDVADRDPAGGRDAAAARTSPPPLADPSATRRSTPTGRRSAAAPTAGLHLTRPVLDRLPRRGRRASRPSSWSSGLDTFRPITVDEVEDHHMHAERYRVPPATLGRRARPRRRGGRVVAIGTTVGAGARERGRDAASSRAAPTCSSSAASPSRSSTAC